MITQHNEQETTPALPDLRVRTLKDPTGQWIVLHRGNLTTFKIRLDEAVPATTRIINAIGRVRDE